MQEDLRGEFEPLYSPPQYSPRIQNILDNGLCMSISLAFSYWIHDTHYLTTDFLNAPDSALLIVKVNIVEPDTEILGTLEEPKDLHTSCMFKHELVFSSLECRVKKLLRKWSQPIELIQLHLHDYPRVVF